MKLTFNVTKENKKAFAKAIEAITGEKAVYQFTPTYAFQIGDLTVNRDATLTAPDDKDIGSLLEALKAQGYELSETEGAPEEKPKEEAPAADEKPEDLEEVPELTVSLPLTVSSGTPSGSQTFESMSPRTRLNSHGLPGNLPPRKQKLTPLSFPCSASSQKS